MLAEISASFVTPDVAVVIELAGIVLVKEPAMEPDTVAVMVQEPGVVKFPAGIVPPLNIKDWLPEPIPTVPPHCEEFAETTVIPLGIVSVKATDVYGEEVGFCITILMVVVPPTTILLTANDFVILID